MTDIFNVDGPIQIEASFDDGTGYVNLGHTPNDNKPRIESRPLQDIYSSDEEGNEPGAVVNNGEENLLLFTVVKWTPSTVDGIRNLARGLASGGTNGTAGKIGQELLQPVGGSGNDGLGTFHIRMTPTLVGKTQRTFKRCMVPPEGIQEINKGNSVTQIVFAIRVHRDDDGAYWVEATTT